ncbi:anthranilate synthase component 1 [Corynebacterium epidermidicanis]|uniref:anthranilate synthase n=1 Tax=Corynebacterium epidermidicanis TaxID=1050174 RepID=A0A0G3GXR8_9CORY|nr:anthranilate synthase component 1 [Corynebacterium epidermidicanis]AKK04328.1 anthranilate synthase, component I [Corynebacterium epidermidicanis]
MKIKVAYPDPEGPNSLSNLRDAIALLESADIHSKEGLQSLAVLQSAARITCHGQTVTVTGHPEIIDFLDERLSEFGSEGKYTFARPNTPTERERLTERSNVEVLRLLQQRDPDALLVGGFAFDYIETFEELPHVSGEGIAYPDYDFVLAEVSLEVDHQTRTAVINGPADQLGHFQQQLRQTHPIAPAPHHEATSITDEEFGSQVTALQEHIHAGDIFQVVPSRRFEVPCDDAFSAYQRLKAINPSPYMFYLRGEGYELFGASPESNLKYTAATRRVELYPIAGTQPRGATPEEDIRRELLLRTDAKEIAEHTMLVDLARNDLARVAKPGTRVVEKLMQVDRYAKVMHLVSLVAAELDEDLDALDAYRACMNMGTLTGAPKLRAIELLRGVEQRRRGAYGGAVGYLRGNGDMDTCIVIRSAYVQDGVAVVQAGAGVVRDSVPALEAAETRHKAAAVLQALGA